MKFVDGKRLDTDKYGRNVCDIAIDDRNLNVEMVRQSLATDWTASE